MATRGGLFEIVPESAPCWFPLPQHTDFCMEVQGPIKSSGTEHLLNFYVTFLLTARLLWAKENISAAGRRLRNALR